MVKNMKKEDFNLSKELIHYRNLSNQALKTSNDITLIETKKITVTACKFGRLHITISLNISSSNFHYKPLSDSMFL